MLPVQGAWVQSLVWELRSYMLCGISKNFKESLEEVTCLPSLIIQFTSLNTTLRILWIELDQELNGEKRRENMSPCEGCMVTLGPILFSVGSFPLHQWCALCEVRGYSKAMAPAWSFDFYLPIPCSLPPQI